MNCIITVATAAERDALVPKELHDKVLITGIGMLNTLISVLPMVNYYDTNVINIGYAGSKDIPVGTICLVDECSSYTQHKIDTGVLVLPPVDSKLPKYHCYTATDFIESTTLDGKFLIDMELLAHSILKCRLTSIKVVSDNLSMDNYDKSLKDDYTNEVAEVLKELGVM